MSTENQKMQLLSAKELGKVLSLSKRQVFRLNSAGKIPAPIRIGGSVRWNSAEILTWIAAGCPDRDNWEATKMAVES
jgi:prophage regulatory protein